MPSRVSSQDDAPTDVDRAVRRAKVELEQMIDLAPQVMLLLGADGCITRVNRAFLRMLGAESFGAVLGRRLSDCFRVEDAAFFDGLLASGGGVTREAAASVDGGAAGTFRFTAVGLRGTSEIQVVLVEDVTDQKARAERDAKANKRDAVRELAGALMHTINQRLTVIMVRAKLMAIALDKNEIPINELKNSLNDVTDLTMEIAGILDKLADQQDFVTVPYVKDIRILDLDRSRRCPE
jgi:nitrogen-specific signal transduction histidine kinase